MYLQLTEQLARQRQEQRSQPTRTASLRVALLSRRREAQRLGG